MSTISLEELAKHDAENDCWVAISGKVYDVTSFLGDHPGGKRILLNQGGKDATEIFNEFHNKRVIKKFGPKFYVGDLQVSSRL